WVCLNCQDCLRGLVAQRLAFGSTLDGLQRHPTDLGRSFVMHMLLIEGKFKQGTKDEFMKTWSGKILPTLKKQQGFVEEILLFADDAREGAGLCFWDSKKDAEHYEHEVFPQQAGSVKDLMEGAPRVRNYNVEYAETFRISAIKAA